MSLFEENTGKSFHVLLREFRHHLGISQEVFSKKYSIGHVRTYKRWEAGKGGPRLPENSHLIIDFFRYLSSIY